MRVLCALSALVVLLGLPAWGVERPPSLEVHFFDVGQGDSALIISPTGKTVLIDAGPPESAPWLAARVASLVKGPLDLVVLTHPHLDHLGGMRAVLLRVGAQRFLEPDVDHPIEPLVKLRELVHVRGIRKQLARFPTLEEERRSASEGAEKRFADNRARLLEIGLGGDATLQVLWPREHAEPLIRNSRSDVNANSVVLKLRYGKTSILFTGDSEDDTERKLMSERRDVGADVLKVAHHGSRHSSSTAFLKAVSPKVAVISAGKNNDYGHPTEELLSRLARVGARTLRTDVDGEVVVRSDGEKLDVRAHAAPARRRGSTVSAESVTEDLRQENVAAASASSNRSSGGRTQPGDGSMSPAEGQTEAARYLGSKRSRVFHRADCGNAKDIKPENLLTFATREEASKRRVPAKDCHP